MNNPTKLEEGHVCLRSTQLKTLMHVLVNRVKLFKVRGSRVGPGVHEMKHQIDVLLSSKPRSAFTTFEQSFIIGYQILWVLKYTSPQMYFLNNLLLIKAFNILVKVLNVLLFKFTICFLFFCGHRHLNLWIKNSSIFSPFLLMNIFSPPVLLANEMTVYFLIAFR